MRKGGDRGEYEEYQNKNSGRYLDRKSRYSNRYVDRYSSRYGKGEYGPRLERSMDSSYDEKVNRNYSNSIFIGNLTYDITPEDLRRHFGDIGKVVRADIITSRGHHRGMGTVEYTNLHSVEEAIRKFNGSTFMDREIFVRQDNPPPFMERRERRSSAFTSRRNCHDFYEIFVANLPYSINWQALKDMFKESSEVIRADVSLNAEGYSRGFGTVYVATKADQLAAIKKWNGFEVEGRILEVREGKGSDSSSNYSDLYGINYRRSFDQRNEYFQYDTENAKTIKKKETNVSVSINDKDFTLKAKSTMKKNNIIYCENMPHATAESDLYDLFETVGKVVRAKLKYDFQNSPTGISVCEFETADDAEECIKRLDNYHYGGCDLKISYATFD